MLDRLDVGDAFWGFSIYDNCGDWHLHGTFTGHDDPDGAPAATASWCILEERNRCSAVAFLPT